MTLLDWHWLPTYQCLPVTHHLFKLISLLMVYSSSSSRPKPIRVAHVWLPDTSATRHFGIKTLWDTSAPVSRHFTKLKSMFRTIDFTFKLLGKF